MGREVGRRPDQRSFVDGNGHSRLCTDFQSAVQRGYNFGCQAPCTHGKGKGGSVPRAGIYTSHTAVQSDFMNVHIRVRTLKRERERERGATLKLPLLRPPKVRGLSWSDSLKSVRNGVTTNHRLTLNTPTLCLARIYPPANRQLAPEQSRHTAPSPTHPDLRCVDAFPANLRWRLYPCMFNYCTILLTVQYHIRDLCVMMGPEGLASLQRRAVTHFEPRNHCFSRSSSSSLLLMT
jgi:hypothetical protein